MSAHAYLLHCGDDSFYAGYTPDMPARLAAHRAGKGAKYTRGRGPLELAFCLLLPDARCARRQEARLKQLDHKKKQALAQNWQTHRLRLARPQDGPALQKIYDYYVKNTAVTFAYETPSPEEYTRWVMDSGRNYPFLVLEGPEDPMGFACAHPWHVREAFGWDVETTVYMAPGLGGQGGGLRLYGALLTLLEMQGVHNAYGVLASPNPASEALHARLGFVRVGLQPDCGWKLGAWYGVSTWGYALRPADGEPAPVVPFYQMDPEKVARLLAYS